MRLLSQYAFDLLFLTVSGALLYYGYGLFFAQRWLFSFISVTVAFMGLAFAGHNVPIRRRIETCLAVPFPIGGLVGFVFLFAQFIDYFEWFREIFNNPFGFVFFAFTGIVVGGYVGFRIVRFSSSQVVLRERTKGSSDNPDNE
jgi:hypothetical protein